MKRVFVSVARKGELSIYEAHERREALDFSRAHSSPESLGWSAYSEPTEFIAVDEVARLIAEAVAAARRAA